MLKVLVSSLGLTLAVTSAPACRPAPGSMVRRTAAAGGRVDVHPDSLSDRAGPRAHRVPPAVRRGRLLQRHPGRSAVGRRKSVRHPGQRGGVRRAARRAAAAADRVHRRVDRRRQGQPDRPLRGRPRRALRDGRAARSDRVAHHRGDAAPRRDLADFLPTTCRQRVQPDRAGAVRQHPGHVIDLLTGMPSQRDAIGALQVAVVGGRGGVQPQFPAGLAATRCGATPSSSGGIPLFSWAGSSQLSPACSTSPIPR